MKFSKRDIEWLVRDSERLDWILSCPQVSLKFRHHKRWNDGIASREKIDEFMARWAEEAARESAAITMNGGAR